MAVLQFQSVSFTLTQLVHIYQDVADEICPSGQLPRPRIDL